MRRWLRVVLAVATLAVAVWWLWPANPPASDEQPAPSSANEGALPETVKQSSWNAPIQQRGERKLTGVVLRDGKPVAGATVTAVAAHGDDVLSDLPCKCDNHCGQMLLACGCAEAAGQLVELVAARTGESAPLARATSDAEGAFTLTGLEAGTLTLFADAPGGVGWLANVASDAQDVKVLLAEGRTIHGKVLTSDEKPARGALVTAIFAAHSRFFDVVTDEKGEFRLGPLPLGEYAVVAMQGGLLPDHKQVDEDDLEPLALELSVPRSLSGVVLANDAPVVGATVKLDGMHRKRTVTTDAKGEFRVERLRPGEYELTAESPQGLGTASAELTKHKDRSGLTITIVKGAPLFGRVVTEGDARVPGARVSLLVGKQWRHTDTDASGVFRFEGVSSDEHRVYARKQGLLDAHGTGQGGQAELELRMERASVLSGSVRSTTGALVLNYSIRARALDGGAEAQHDVGGSSVDGGFELEVWPGEYELQVEAPPLAHAALKVSAPSRGLLLVMKPGATIRALVLDFDGVAAPGMRISAERQGSASETAGRTGKTDAQGRFEFKGLEAGTWVVQGMMFEDYLVSWRVSGTVTLSEAGSTELILRPRPGVSLAGVVISSDGAPVEGARVLGWQSAADAGVEPEGLTSATSDAQGRFRIRGLHAGPVHLMATLDAQHLEGSLSTAAPAENVVIKLSGGTTISGRVVSTDGQPLTVFAIEHEEVTAADGRFKTAVEPRSTVVAFDAEGYAQQGRKVELKPGDNPLGDVVMQRGRPVTGIIRDVRTRAPIAGALVDVGPGRMDAEFFLSEETGAVKSDSQGRYRLPAVDSSSTHVFVTAARYVTAVQPLSGNSADFELRPASVLRVKVLDAAGAAMKSAFLLLQSEGRRLPLHAHAAGKFETQDLAPGVWTVSAHATGEHTFRSVEVTLGETPVELVMREATDGVTVELKVSGLADGLSLVPGAVSSPGELKRVVLSGLRATNGVVRHVLPGPWTVVAFRGQPPTEAALQVIEVQANGNTVWNITPQWQPVDWTALMR